MKKAQGLSMTTIVIAALSLLVLVILILIFTGRMNLFSGGVDESSACSNYCKSLGKQMITTNEVEIPETGTQDKKCPDGSSLVPAVVLKKQQKEYYCCCEPKP